MDVKRWRTRALDRIEWASVVWKPKPKIYGCCAEEEEEEEEEEEGGEGEEEGL